MQRNRPLSGLQRHRRHILRLIATRLGGEVKTRPRRRFYGQSETPLKRDAGSVCHSPTSPKRRHVTRPNVFGKTTVDVRARFVILPNRLSAVSSRSSPATKRVPSVPARRKNAKTSKRQNVKTQKRKNAKTQKRKNVKTSKRQNVKTQKRQNAKTPKRQNAKTPKRRPFSRLLSTAPSDATAVPVARKRRLCSRQTDVARLSPPSTLRAFVVLPRFNGQAQLRKRLN